MPISPALSSARDHMRPEVWKDGADWSRLSHFGHRSAKRTIGFGGGAVGALLEARLSSLVARLALVTK